MEGIGALKTEQSVKIALNKEEKLEFLGDSTIF